MYKQSHAAPSREQIWKMFDQIAITYDRVNRVMTMGLDQLWRKKLCSFLPIREGLSILDCATGTADQIISILRMRPDIQSIVGIDLAEEMVAIGKQKIAKTTYKSKVSLQIASALELPFADHSFDCVTISFGIRNVTDVSLALSEFYRVLKPNGRLLILEGTVPEKKWLKVFHLFYLRHFLPRIGALISKNEKAYRYLNETIETFPQGVRFCELLEKAQFLKVKSHLLMGGMTTIYQGDKNVST